MNEYLTEGKLASVLEKLFPKHTFIHDKTVPNSGTRKRPDYRCDELMLIVEFDGDIHYKEVAKIKSEQQKDSTYTTMGYQVVRIPYFVQISTDTIKHFFDLQVNWEQTYSHGFISEKVILPCDYCELGIQKFLNDLKRFDFIKNDIIESLKNKIIDLKDHELVLPSSIGHICK